MRKNYLLGVSEEDAKGVMEEAQRRKEGFTNKGYSKTKELKQIAVIPYMVFHLHPEFWEDDKALLKYLKEHPELQVSKP